MPADEVTHGTDVEASIPVRTGPRHAAPKKPLFTRFHMPAGKAIALAAMPTAVLMGMGFTPTLANAEDQPTSKSLTIDEYKECVAALEDADASASASPSPSASESTEDSKDADDSKDESSTAPSTGGSKDTSSGSGGSSSDSGSDEEAEPAPSASSAPAASAGKPASPSGDTATATPSATETEKKNVLETIGDAIGDLFDGGKSDDETPAPAETPSASTGTGDDTSDPGTGSSDPGSSGSGSSGGSAEGGSGAAKDSKDKDSKDSKDAGDTKDTVTDTVKDAADAVEDAADEATASPSASPSESADDVVDDCPVATLDESGVDNKTPIADDPWYLNASSLLLKGADYKGVVEVKTANGTKKKVLKYVISGGTDIGDLHQTVEDKQAGKTYHVQASSGSTSTIRDGDTIMYTQSISGNLFGLIPVTFDPENPPPLNIPLIYFTKVKVVQAAQMGGNLHIPGMHVYTD
ncbi:hypothetical protein [Streptomyces sp. Amel2xC10]|uniref:hypothetical protein n=1 Tax=Streptomyces sp. Amel2xC10 TaxID=1305826 RepID=UPI000A08F573|nr:hypothetical protein [Streptomyces sp. Amel2xC10]SMF55279.1 hypothetical protein SAMN02745830_04419 [Streptomyces sp. Amel2xC10]